MIRYDPYIEDKPLVIARNRRTLKLLKAKRRDDTIVNLAEASIPEQWQKDIKAIGISQDPNITEARQKLLHKYRSSFLNIIKRDFPELFI